MVIKIDSLGTVGMTLIDRKGSWQPIAEFYFFKYFTKKISVGSSQNHKWLERRTNILTLHPWKYGTKGLKTNCLVTIKGYKKRYELYLYCISIQYSFEHQRWIGMKWERKLQGSCPSCTHAGQLCSASVRSACGLKWLNSLCPCALKARGSRGLRWLLTRDWPLQVNIHRHAGSRLQEHTAAE